MGRGPRGAGTSSLNSMGSGADFRFILHGMEVTGKFKQGSDTI